MHATRLNASSATHNPRRVCAGRSVALERAFDRTYVRMTTDARGWLWIDNPLLALALLSLVWVLIAWLDRFGGRHILVHRRRRVHAVRAQTVVPVARQLEQYHVTFVALVGCRRLPLDGLAARRTSLAQVLAVEAGVPADAAHQHVGVLPCEVHLSERGSQ